ncbi:hypothetical protein AA313_de0204823 [Arthrobotrys entomopaga]|nr:hypothetical protein AA313_de0204823 [Arthrobotrys entomopaga]
MKLYLVGEHDSRGEYGSIDHVVVKTLEEWEWGCLLGIDRRLPKLPDPFPEGFEVCMCQSNPGLLPRKELAKEISLQDKFNLGKMVKKFAEDMVYGSLKKGKIDDFIEAVKRGGKQQRKDVLAQILKKLANEDKE